MDAKSFTMISTTNPRFKYLEGYMSGILVYDTKNNVYWLNDFHTSHVKETKVNKRNKTITITTLNSVYIFKENK